MNQKHIDESLVLILNEFFSNDKNIKLIEFTIEYSFLLFIVSDYIKQ